MRRDSGLRVTLLLHDAHGKDGPSAINDGMAFPMVMLALGLLSAHPLGHFRTHWLLVDFLWAVVGGAGVGFACGRLVCGVVLWLRRSGSALEFEEFLVLGVIGLVYGVALLTHTYGFLAVSLLPWRSTMPSAALERESGSPLGS